MGEANPDKIIVVLIGLTGTGKSTLGNILLGFDPNTQGHIGDGPFQTSPDAASQTSKVLSAEGHFLGDPQRPITVVDTPGLGDSEGRDQEFRDKMVASLQGLNKFHVLLWLRNAQNPRIDAQEKAYMEILVKLFGACIVDNCLINFSSWPHDPLSIKKMEKQKRSFEKLCGGFYDELMKQTKAAKIATKLGWNGLAEVGKEDRIPMCAVDAVYDGDCPEERNAFGEHTTYMWNIFQEYKKTPIFDLAFLSDRLIEIKKEENKFNDMMEQTQEELKKTQEKANQLEIDQLAQEQKIREQETKMEQERIENEQRLRQEKKEYEERMEQERKAHEEEMRKQNLAREEFEKRLQEKEEQQEREREQYLQEVKRQQKEREEYEERMRKREEEAVKERERERKELEAREQRLQQQQREDEQRRQQLEKERQELSAAQNRIPRKKRCVIM